MTARWSSRRDWIERWFGGLARRANELRCPTKWEVIREDFIEDFPRLAKLFRIKP